MKNEGVCSGFGLGLVGVENEEHLGLVGVENEERRGLFWV